MAETKSISVTLPLVRETPGALKYAVTDLRAVPVGAVYVRKDHLLDAGHTGPWPQSMKVTVEPVP